MTIYETGDRVTSPYGMRTLNGKTAMHNGLDASKGAGTKQRACIPGNIEWVSYGYNYGRGNNVIIKQTTSKGVVRIRHQHASVILAAKGQAVSATDFVATEGTSGDVTGAHDHFEVVIGGTLNTNTGEIVGGTAVNPAPWLGYPNAVGNYPRNDNVYYYGSDAITPERDNDMKMGIYAKSDGTPSSKALLDGAIIRNVNGKPVLFTRRMVREVTEQTASSVYEKMFYDESRDGELIAVTDD